MLKKGASLKQSRRNPTQYFADLQMLNEMENKDRFEPALSQSVHKRDDKTMEVHPDYEEEKE